MIIPIPYNAFIVDCRSLLQYFEEAHISHIHSKGNHYADILAKEGLHNPNSLVLHSSPPSYILYQLLADTWSVLYPRLCTSFNLNALSGLLKKKLYVQESS